MSNFDIKCHILSCLPVPGCDPGPFIKLFPCDSFKFAVFLNSNPLVFFLFQGVPYGSHTATSCPIIDSV